MVVFECGEVASAAVGGDNGCAWARVRGRGLPPSFYETLCMQIVIYIKIIKYSYWQHRYDASLEVRASFDADESRAYHTSYGVCFEYQLGTDDLFSLLQS